MKKCVSDGFKGDNKKAVRKTNDAEMLYHSGL